MAYTSKRLCGHVGCPNLVTSGYCKHHESERKIYRNIEREKQPGRHLYLTEAWRRIRDYHLSIQPACVECGKTEGVIVDHITPHRGNEQSFYSGPFQTLCRSHHASKTRKYDGWTGKNINDY